MNFIGSSTSHSKPESSVLRRPRFAAEFTVRSSDGGSVTLNVRPSGQTFVDWGDGNTEEVRQTDSVSHYYGKAGTYRVSVTAGAIFYMGFAELDDASVTDIGTLSCALLSDAMQKVRVPPRPKYLGDPSNVFIYFGDRAFSYARNLVSLADVTACPAYVGVECFRGCTSLKDLEGFGRINTFPRGCFYGCSSLDLRPTDPVFDWIKNKTPFTWNLGEECFCGTGLTTLDFMSAIRTVVVGKGCFANCTKLTDRSAMERFKSANGFVLPARCFAGCTALVTGGLRTYWETVDDGAFDGCSSMETIGEPGFWVSRYGKRALAGTALTSADLSSYAEKVGDECMYGCVRLTTLDGFCPREPNAQAPTVGDRCFSHCGTLTVLPPESEYTDEPSGFTTDGLYDIGGIFLTRITKFSTGLFEACVNIRTVVPPEDCDLASLGDRCFAGCVSLESLDWIPEGLMALDPSDPTAVPIGDECFAGCSYVLNTYRENDKNPEFVDFCGLFDATRLGLLDSDRLPDGLFDGCAVLHKFPDLDPYCTSFGDRCFAGCELLDLPCEKPPYVKTVDNADGTTGYVYPEWPTFGDECFSGCSPKSGHPNPITLLSVNRPERTPFYVHDPDRFPNDGSYPYYGPPRNIRFVQKMVNRIAATRMSLLAQPMVYANVYGTIRDIIAGSPAYEFGTDVDPLITDLSSMLSITPFMDQASELIVSRMKSFGFEREPEDCLHSFPVMADLTVVMRDESDRMVTKRFTIAWRMERRHSGLVPTVVLDDLMPCDPLAADDGEPVNIMRFTTNGVRHSVGISASAVEDGAGFRITVGGMSYTTYDKDGNIVSTLRHSGTVVADCSHPITDDADIRFDYVMSWMSSVYAAVAESYAYRYPHNVPSASSDTFALYVRRLFGSPLSRKLFDAMFPDYLWRGTSRTFGRACFADSEKMDLATVGLWAFENELPDRMAANTATSSFAPFEHARMIGDGCFDGCAGITGPIGEFRPNNIPSRCFAGTGITSIANVPPGVEFGEGSFEGARSLVYVETMEKDIESARFMDWWSLRSRTVTVIPRRCFAGTGLYGIAFHPTALQLTRPPMDSNTYTWFMYLFGEYCRVSVNDVTHISDGVADGQKHVVVTVEDIHNPGPKAQIRLAVQPGGILPPVYTLAGTTVVRNVWVAADVLEVVRPGGYISATRTPIRQLGTTDMILSRNSTYTDPYIRFSAGGSGRIVVTRNGLQTSVRLVFGENLQTVVGLYVDPAEDVPAPEVGTDGWISFFPKLEHVGEEAFEGSAIERLHGFPDAITKYPDRCFANCLELKSLEGMSESVTEFGRQCFAACVFSSLGATHDFRINVITPGIYDSLKKKDPKDSTPYEADLFDRLDRITTALMNVEFDSTALHPVGLRVRVSFPSFVGGDNLIEFDRTRSEPELVPTYVLSTETRRLYVSGSDDYVTMVSVKHDEAAQKTVVKFDPWYGNTGTWTVEILGDIYVRKHAAVIPGHVQTIGKDCFNPDGYPEQEEHLDDLQFMGQDPRYMSNFPWGVPVGCTIRNSEGHVVYVRR